MSILSIVTPHEDQTSHVGERANTALWKALREKKICSLKFLLLMNMASQLASTHDLLTKL